MDYFPIFLNLQGRDALVVGGTESAAQKARLLLRAGARLTVVDPAPGPAMRSLLGEPLVRLVPRRFVGRDLDGMQIAIAASRDEAIDRIVSAAAQARGIPVNVVDRPELCSVIMPAFVDRSPLIVAVSSGGASPVLARLVRARIEALLPQAIGAFASLAAAFRAQVARRIAPFKRRRFWEAVLEGEAAALAFAHRLDDAATDLQDALDAAACPAAEPCVAFCRHPERCQGPRQGEVWLVGAGPGDPDLLTAKALRLMQRCDVALHDPLVPPAVLDRVRRDAEVIALDAAPDAIGWSKKRIDHLLIDRARAGQRVLWLQAGDPTRVGRSGELLDALHRAGIACLLVPGVAATPNAATALVTSAP